MVTEDTRERILDAAERLFAERGFDGTSVRDVTAEAGVNLAAVHYHFGSKDVLFAAVLQRVIAPIRAEQLRMMDEAEANPAGLQVEALLAAFTLPELRLERELGARGKTVVHLLSRMFAEPNAAVRDICVGEMGIAGGRFIAGLALLYPDLPPEELAFRMQCVIGVLVFFMADNVPPEWKVVDLAEPEKIFEHMSAFLVPALGAPSSRARSENVGAGTETGTPTGDPAASSCQDGGKSA